MYCTHHLPVLSPEAITIHHQFFPVAAPGFHLPVLSIQRSHPADVPHLYSIVSVFFPAVSSGATILFFSFHSCMLQVLPMLPPWFFCSHSIAFFYHSHYITTAKQNANITGLQARHSSSLIIIAHGVCMFRDQCYLLFRMKHGNVLLKFQKFLYLTKPQRLLALWLFYLG
jgi:hypothetical protein